MRVISCGFSSIVTFALIGCTNPEADYRGWEGSIRDSAGIVIVQNHGVAMWETPWRVTPDLAFGSLDGADAFVFGRIADVAVDRIGNMFVLDEQAQEVRVFDSSGAYVRTFGGGGEGPGELSRFTTDVLTSASDTVFVPDYAQARINAFSDGEVRTIAIPSLPFGRSWVRLEDGRFVYRGVAISRDERGRFQTWDGLMRFAPDTGELDTLLAFDYERTELGSPDEIRIPLIVNTPFWTRLGDGRIVWSTIDRNWIHVTDSNGVIERIVYARQWEARELTESDRTVMVDLLGRKLENLGGDASVADGPNVDAPEYLPAITGVRAGPDGTIWVQRMGEPRSIDPMAINAADRSEWLGGSNWDVLDGTGRYLGSVEVPMRFRITRIRDTAVYGIARDATTDLERVMRLRLERHGT